MMNDEALAPLRRTGMRAITAFLLANVVAIALVGLLLGSADTWPACLMAALIAIIPTWSSYHGRIDAATRMSFGIALPLYPALFVYLFQGHPWQMDMHMYFFVCFSLMVLLCDRFPILIGAALTVGHHLLLYLLLPDWVFPGSGSLPRVLLHGFLVSCEVAILLTAVNLITRLTINNVNERTEADAARTQAENALRDADIARANAEKALMQSREAEARAEQEHRDRLAAEAALHDLGVARRQATADEIEAGIGALIEDLRAAAEDIAEQARDISSVSTVLVEQASGLSASSASAVASIESVAQNSDELTAAIRSVGSNAQAAQGVALATADSISTLEPGIDRLTHEVDAARDILAMVSKIASQSNLLALNASIEAARSGEAGRGFAVVAGEMKQMATATGRATDDIAAKLGGIVSAATAFRALIATSTTHADKIKASNSAIFAAVEQQQVATDAIANGADRMLAKAIDTDSRSRTLSEVAETNNSIATNATVLAHKLGQGADELWDRMNDLLGELRAA